MKERKMYLPSLDDMFSTQEERDAEKLEKVVNISLKDIEEILLKAYSKIKDYTNK